MIALAVTVIFINSEKLGVTKIVDEDAEGYEAESGFTANDMDGDWDTSSATVITLEGDGASISGKGAYEYAGSVYITGAGYYVVSGELTDGSIYVDAYDSSKVWIMLSGADIYCSDSAAIYVKKADKVFLTLADGTVNNIETGETYSEEALSDKAGGAIYTHDDLTINGDGELNITAAYKHGIDANDALVITGGTITITAPQDGLHVNDEFNIREAVLNIYADDDGMHSDTSILIVSGTILIDGCYEGIEAITIDIQGGDITIYPTDDGLNANGGSSGFGGGMPGGGFGGGHSMSDDSRDASVDTETAAYDTVKAAETDDTDSETWIHISGGNIYIYNESGNDADGLDSNGDLIITGGTIRVSLVGTGSNSAIDYGSENGGVCEISGGNIIACGGYGMAEAFDSTSEQCAILYIYSDGAEAGSELNLINEDGDVLLSWEVPYSYTAVNISCPELELGGSYTIVIGDKEETIDITETSASYGDAVSGGFGGNHNMGGGMMDRGGFGGGRGGHRGMQSRDGDTVDMPDMTGMPQMSDGDRPELPEGLEITPGAMPEEMPDMSGADMESGMMQGGDMRGGPDGMNADNAEASADTEISSAKNISEYDDNTIGMLAASVVVLLAGLGFAILFRRS